MILLWFGLNRKSQHISDVQTEKIRNDVNMIRKFFIKLKRKYDIRSCYEAGPCGYTMYRKLSRMNIKCDVIAPSLIPKKAGDKVKTDKRDAKKLTQLYRGGYLTIIRVPTKEEEEDRTLICCREQYTDKIKRVKHREQVSFQELILSLIFGH